MLRKFLSPLFVFGVFLQFANAKSVEGKEFPLGEIPAGWVYTEISEIVRGIEGLPFEVNGILERNLTPDKKVYVYVVMVPVARGAGRTPASLWNWVDQTFVPSGINKAKSFEMNVQKNVGPTKKWTFREAQITRAGIPMNLAALYTQTKYHHVYLVLREDGKDYQIRLTQLKDLASEIRVN